MSANVIAVTESSFSTEVLQSNIPVLVDFWAPWCGPCRMLAPTVENIADDFVGKIKVSKVNVDDEPSLSAKYNIRGIPSLLLFKDGRVVDTSVGSINKNQLTDFINKNLNVF